MRATPGSAPSSPASQRSVSVVLRLRSAAKVVMYAHQVPRMSCAHRRNGALAVLAPRVLSGPAQPSGWRTGSERVSAALARAHPDHRLDRLHPHLAVPDPAGLRCLDDHADEVLGVFVIADDLDPDLGYQVHLVLRAPVHLGVPALPAVSARFTDCHAVHAERLQRRLDIIEFEGLDDSRNELHGVTLSLA